MRWLILLLAFFALPAVAEVREAEKHFFMSHLGDFKEELDAARSDGKLGVLIMFEMDECPFCTRMKTMVLNQRLVQDYFRQHFLTYPVDVKGDVPLVDFKGNQTTEKAFALSNRARATPVFIFFDLDGNVLTRFTGATKTVDEFMLLGRYVVEGVYKTTPFNVYKRQSTAP